MSFPSPRPGLVIRYRFLCSHERDAGADEAAKDRPCAIVVAARRGEGGDIIVIVAQITRAPPDDPAASIALPPAVARALGLDAGKHWLRLDNLNRFAWPGYDLRAIPGRPGEYADGMLSQPLSNSCAPRSSKVRRRGPGGCWGGRELDAVSPKLLL